MDQQVVRKSAVLTGHTGSVYALASTGDDAFVSAGSDRLIASWNLKHGVDGNVLANVPEIVYSLLDMNHRKLLLAGQAQGGIHVIDLSTGSEGRLLQYHEGPVFSLVHSNVNHKIFSCAGDGTLVMMEAESFSLEKKMKLSQGKLRSCTLSPDHSMLAVGSAEGIVYVFSLPELTALTSWQAHQQGFSVNALSFSPGGNHLLTGARDAHLNIFDVRNQFKQVHSIPAHNYAIYGITFNKQGTLLATCSRDKSVKIWDPESYSVLYRMDKDRNQGHVNSVNKIVWLPDGRLVSTGDDRSIIVWDLKDESRSAWLS